MKIEGNSCQQLQILLFLVCIRVKALLYPPGEFNVYCEVTSAETTGRLAREPMFPNSVSMRKAESYGDRKFNITHNRIIKYVPIPRKSGLSLIPQIVYINIILI